MPIFVINATRLRGQQGRISALHLYGDKPRAYRDLEDAWTRMQELRTQTRETMNVDYEIEEVPIDLSHLYRPLG
ncbi:MAG TPA: hypothetical protein VJM53_05820 [Burkholderiales bacterium]|nr:hypothetical protein [Burkholderiales bacterium]